MFDFLTYAFMQRAFLAGMLVAVLCPTIGIYLVLRRLSMIGEMFAHVSLAGVALGMFAGIYPLASALVLSLGAAAGLEAVRKAYRMFGDLAIAIMISAGIGLAVVLISLSQGFNAGLFSYLFGTVVAITRADLLMIAGVSLAVLLMVYLLHKEFFLIAFDEEAARASGVRVDFLNMLFIMATSLTITVTMRVVGILLVSSLLTIPVAAALQLGRSFRATVIYAYLFAQVAVLAGLFVSYHGNLAPGGSIVLISVALFVFAACYKKLTGMGGRRHVSSGAPESYERQGI